VFKLKSDSEGLHGKSATVPNYELHICIKTEGKQENLCRDGPSQDLPDAHSLLASSPANKVTWEFLTYRKTWLQLNNIFKKFGIYLIENTLHLEYKDETVKTL
jgi:hypothetical protein